VSKLETTLFVLILAVCCAHAMTHVLEGSLPCVEQSIAATYQVDTKTTGWLLTCWRVPWGIFALPAGWLVDRYGAKRMLACFLLGSGVCCVTTATIPGLPSLFVSMLLMGTFASIYHPAGLALLSHETTPDTLPKTLGWHGVFGSLGIGGAPLIAAVVLAATDSWQAFYWVLALMCAVLGGVFVVKTMQSPERIYRPHPQETNTDRGDWLGFAGVVCLSIFWGLTYHGVLSFLPRYLSDAQIGTWSFQGEVEGNILASCSLIIGCIGQYLSGHFAKSRILEWQLMSIGIASVPFLIGMSFAAPGWKLPLVAGWGLIFFMHQPIANSLIAKYTSKARRSLCYGISFAVGNGIGAFSAAFVGESGSLKTAYLGLSGCIMIASAIGGLLAIRAHRKRQLP